jgi:hypothetical protein
MGSLGATGKGKNWGKPLVCPNCGRKVAWDGIQYVCPKCSWTEHKEKPPSSSKIDLPKEILDRKQPETK